MKKISIMLLRISVGILMILWGIDKLINTSHALQVSDHFYWGLFSNALAQQVFGVFETLLGVAVVLGWKRRLFYPPLIVINAFSALGSWKSIIDPWGWFLEGAHVLLYPGLIILFACVVLQAFLNDDVYALDKPS